MGRRRDVMAAVLVGACLLGACERAKRSPADDWLLARHHLSPRTDLEHAARVWQMMTTFERQTNSWVDIDAMRSHVTALGRTHPSAAELLVRRVLESPVVRYPVHRERPAAWPTRESVVVEGLMEAGLPRLAIRR